MKLAVVKALTSKIREVSLRNVPLFGRIGFTGIIAAKVPGDSKFLMETMDVARTIDQRNEGLDRIIDEIG